MTTWKSFLGMVRFILTKYEPICIHGDPIHITCCSKIDKFDNIIRFLFEHFLKRGEQCKASGASTQRKVTSGDPLQLDFLQRGIFVLVSTTSSRFVKGTPFLILRPSWIYFTETLFPMWGPIQLLISWIFRPFLNLGEPGC